MGFVAKLIEKNKKYNYEYFDIVMGTDVPNVKIVAKDCCYGLWDEQTRKLIVGLVYDHIDSYSAQGLAVAIKDGKFGFINSKNEIVIPFEYEYASAFNGELARVKKDGKFGCVNTKNEAIIPLEYDNISEFCTYYVDHAYGGKSFKVLDSLAKATKNGKWGYIHKSGEIIGDIVFDEIGYISQNMFNAKLDNKWGYINLLGEQVIPFKFSEAQPFIKGYAKVKQNGKWGLINQQGEKAVACSYDKIALVSPDIACVMSNGKYGYVSTDNKTIVPCCLSITVGKDDEDYESSIKLLKEKYLSNLFDVKTRTAKDNVIREFNRELKALADARVALFSYKTNRTKKQGQQDYRKKIDYLVDLYQDAPQDLNIRED